MRQVQQQQPTVACVLTRREDTPAQQPPPLPQLPANACKSSTSAQPKVLRSHRAVVVVHVHLPHAQPAVVLQPLTNVAVLVLDYRTDGHIAVWELTRVCLFLGGRWQGRTGSRHTAAAMQAKKIQGHAQKQVHVVRQMLHA